MNNSPNLVRIRRIATGIFLAAVVAVGGIVLELAGHQPGSRGWAATEPVHTAVIYPHAHTAGS